MAWLIKLKIGQLEGLVKTFQTKRKSYTKGKCDLREVDNYFNRIDTLIEETKEQLVEFFNKKPSTTGIVALETLNSYLDTIYSNMKNTYKVIASKAEKLNARKEWRKAALYPLKHTLGYTVNELKIAYKNILEGMTK